MTLLGSWEHRTRAASLLATAHEHEPVDPISAFGTAGAAGIDASLWLDPGTGTAILGVGVAVSVAPDGPDRFGSLGRAWRALAESIEVTGPAARSPQAGPMLLGGAAFRDRPSRDPRWEGFGPLAFHVPRLLLVRDAAGTTVLTMVGERGEDLDREAWPEALLATYPQPYSDPLPHLDVVGLEPERAAWSASVARIAGAVGRGRLDKVVLARRVDLRADRPLDPVWVLRRLDAADRADPSPGPRVSSTLFAFARGGRTFLGSSPERLASVRGEALRTMALAGTAGRGPDAARDAGMGAALLASEKDREEHAVVVTMLRETLARLVTELDLPRVPRIVRSARLQHLLTEASGTLRAGVGLLDVVQRLHPTPAVAGWPTEAALELLDDESALDRGWFAGAVGWIDRAGDGDVAVAIRSGIVSGHDASLYAGCGIVADSEPDREWEESSLKLRVMGDALGWSGT
jgi:isochorismate synthase